jgi:hypothetical protein
MIKLKRKKEREKIHKKTKEIVIIKSNLNDSNDRLQNVAAGICIS